LYIGPPPNRTFGPFSLTVDDTVPACLTDLLVASGQASFTYYTRLVGRAPDGQLAVFVQADPAFGDGPFSYQGDVVGGMIRLSFRGSDLAQPCTTRKGELARLIAHELAHIWQRVAGEEEIWALEGFAEFLAIVSTNSFVRVDSKPGSFVEDTVNACLLTVGQKTWQQAVQVSGGSIPYQCGVAVAVALSASPTGRSSDAIWEQVVAKAEVPSALELAARLEADLSTDWTSLIAVLRSEIGVADGMLAQLSSQPNSGFRLESPTHKRHGLWMARSVLRELLEANCSGPADIQDRGRGFAVECDQVDLTGTVVGYAGRSLKRDPVAAALAVMDTCSEGSTVDLQLDGGTKHPMRCGDAAKASSRTVIRIPDNHIETLIEF
jgi:hypothetical protein